MTRVGADVVIDCRNLWKIFGRRADESMKAVQEQKFGKLEVRDRFDCVVGVQDASFTVGRGEIFCISDYVEMHARMTHEEANWRLSLTQPSGYSNSFSPGNEGKATRDDLHRKDWDGSSLRAGPAAPPHLSPSWRWVTVG